MDSSCSLQSAWLERFFGIESVYLILIETSCKMHVFTNSDGDDHPPVTWYPSSGLIAYKDTLFRVDYPNDIRVMRNAVQYNSSAKVHTARDYPVMANVTFFEINVDIERGNTAIPNPINSILWRKLQTWMKITAIRCITARRQRNMAFVMVCHSRLGANSMAACLPDDIVASILTRRALKHPAYSTQQLSVLETEA
jgi:hypothetical protein